MPEITVDGTPLHVPAGVTVAAALIAAGRLGWRETRRRGELRGVSCGIGACFDCLVTLNGAPGVRACLVDVEGGDEIRTERGSGYAGDTI
jgi:NADH dehydrogenase/NADH:ubiquinone oxidoreductase subunit G